MHIILFGEGGEKIFLCKAKLYYHVEDSFCADIFITCIPAKNGKDVFIRKSFWCKKLFIGRIKVNETS